MNGGAEGGSLGRTSARAFKARIVAPMSTMKKLLRKCVSQLERKAVTMFSAHGLLNT